MDCQIVVANLATNQPQKVIDISPMRFVAFIHMGLQQQQSEVDVNTHIHFLAYLEIKGKPVFRVMRYSQFPYSFPTGIKDTKDFYVDGILSILSGAVSALPYLDTKSSFKLQLKENQDINALCREKIRCCSLLESERVGGKAVLLVL